MKSKSFLNKNKKTAVKFSKYFALFPLRGDNEINFLRKKMRGLGYSVLRKQNTAIPQCGEVRRKI